MGHKLSQLSQEVGRHPVPATSPIQDRFNPEPSWEDSPVLITLNIFFFYLFSIKVSHWHLKLFSLFYNWIFYPPQNNAAQNFFAIVSLFGLSINAKETSWQVKHNDPYTILRESNNPLTCAFALLNWLSCPHGHFCVLFSTFFICNNNKKKMNEALGSCICCWPHSLPHWSKIICALKGLET